MKKLGVVFLCACLAWTAFIFSRSAKTASESSSESGAVTEILSDILDTIGIDVVPTEHFVRKAGHFTEYAILGFLAVFSVWAFGVKHACPAGFGYAVAVACADEFLVQRLTEGRSPQFSDVLIDSAGAGTAILCFFVCVSLLFLKKLPKTLDK